MKRRLLDGFFMAVALWLAVRLAYLFVGFASMAEPDEFGWDVIVFAGVIGMVSQSGLWLLLPWARRRPWFARVPCLLLMAPVAGGLAVALWEGVTRYYWGQQPLQIEAFLTYALGLGMYVLGFIVLLRTPHTSVRGTPGAGHDW